MQKSCDISARFLAVLLLAIVIPMSCQAEETCSAWTAPVADSSNGQYPVQLRICDMAYGLSTLVQFQNTGDQRLQVFFRITSQDDKYKDTDAVLEPRTVSRGGNCQACAKRHAGFKSWEILKVDVLATIPKPVADVPAPPAQPVAPLQPAAPVVSTPVTAPAPAAATVPAPAVTPLAQPAQPEKQKKDNNQKDNDQKNKDQKDKEQEGFRTEDGKVIPYDQLPPEFRPRGK